MYVNTEVEPVVLTLTSMNEHRHASLTQLYGYMTQGAGLGLLERLQPDERAVSKKATV